LVNSTTLMPFFADKTKLARPDSVNYDKSQVKV
jgi:hypothetical protein